MNKFITLISLQCLILQCLTAPGHISGGYGGGKNQGPLMATPDVASYSKISYPKGQLIDLGEYNKGEYPEKVIKITKTYAIKVPQPYPVKIKQNVPVPYPVAHPYPVTVPKIVKVPHPVPVEIIKRVEVPVPVNSHSHFSLSANDFAQHDYSVQHGPSGAYGANGGQGILGHPGLQLVQFKYNENFGTGGDQHQQGAGSDGIYQQHEEQEEQPQQYAAYPMHIMQQQNYGQVEVSHHGIQDGVDGYSIHTVSMNVPQHQEQRDASGGESDDASLAMQQAAEEGHQQ